MPYAILPTYSRIKFVHADILNLGLAFLEGLALIISPCILPILPIILAGSFAGSKKRPLGIMFGFILIFSLFTFFSRQLVQYAGVDSNVLRHIAYGLLFLLGIIMLSTFLTEQFSRVTRRLTQVGARLDRINNNESGFIGGMIFGGLIGIIWTPCAGPILAAVIVQAVIQQTNWLSFLIVVAFSIGVTVPMLLIVLFGRKVMARFAFIRTHTVFLRKLLGAIIVVSVLYLLYMESNVYAGITSTSVTQTATTLENPLDTPYPAPPLIGITTWINSPPLTMESLRGKVVLIDFWTYSCINCLRTLPYLKSWYAKYHDQGLVIIGVHAPEFDFEKNVENVKNAVKKLGIVYPVALDNDFITWRAYQNQYWPAHYLTDKQGQVVYQHFGEGDYDATENNIRVLLGLTQQTERGANLSSTFATLTPETYLGYARADHFASPESMGEDRVTLYTFPATLRQDQWALRGSWKIFSDRAVAVGQNTGLQLHFRAAKVFMVMGSAQGLVVPVRILLNGKPLLQGQGKDVHGGRVPVSQATLYEIVQLTKVQDGLLDIIPETPGLEIYTFTFGE